MILLARRRVLLEEVAKSIHADTGVDVRALPVDLSREEAMPAIIEATAGLDIGMLMYNAGADAYYEPFLANPVDVALSMVQRNCVALTQLCHHFAGPMAERGRGGIVLVSSGAGFQGGPNMVAYGATKAFGIVMAEALWSELHHQGVDVLALVLGMTDTPALRRMLAKRGVLSSPDDTSPIPGASTPEEAVSDAIAKLSDGPTWIVGERTRDTSEQLRSMSRNDAVKAVLQRVAGPESVMNKD